MFVYLLVLALKSLGLSDVDLDVPAVHFEAVERFARRLRRLLGAKRHEPEAAAAERLLALRQVLAVLDFAELGKDFVQGVWMGVGRVRKAHPPEKCLCAFYVLFSHI